MKQARFTMTPPSCCRHHHYHHHLRLSLTRIGACPTHAQQLLPIHGDEGIGRSVGGNWAGVGSRLPLSSFFCRLTSPKFVALAWYPRHQQHWRGSLDDISSCYISLSQIINGSSKLRRGCALLPPNPSIMSMMILLDI